MIHTSCTSRFPYTSLPTIIQSASDAWTTAAFCRYTLESLNTPSSSPYPRPPSASAYVSTGASHNLTSSSSRPTPLSPGQSLPACGVPCHFCRSNGPISRNYLRRHRAPRNQLPPPPKIFLFTPSSSFSDNFSCPPSPSPPLNGNIAVVAGIGTEPLSPLSPPMHPSTPLPSTPPQNCALRVVNQLGKGRDWW